MKIPCGMTENLPQSETAGDSELTVYAAETSLPSPVSSFGAVLFSTQSAVTSTFFTFPSDGASNIVCMRSVDSAANPPANIASRP